MKDLTIENPRVRPPLRLPVQLVEPAAPLPAGSDRELALAALANTNEGMRHRAHDCRLDAVSNLTRLLGVQLARVRSGALALGDARLAQLQHASALIAQLLDAQFDGCAPGPAAIERVRAQLEVAAQVGPQSCAAVRQGQPGGDG
ncbi:MAG: hypothetical protein WKG03_10505 [Telluria sp.]